MANRGSAIEGVLLLDSNKKERNIDSNCNTTVIRLISGNALVSTKHSKGYAFGEAAEILGDRHPPLFSSAFFEFCS